MSKIARHEQACKRASKHAGQERGPHLSMVVVGSHAVLVCGSLDAGLGAMAVVKIIAHLDTRRGRALDDRIGSEGGQCQAESASK